MWRRVEIDDGALTTVIEELPALFARRRTEKMSAGEILDALYTTHKDEGAFDALRVAIKKLCGVSVVPRPLTAHRLGIRFRMCRGKLVCGKRLASAFDPVLEVHLWRVESLDEA